MNAKHLLLALSLTLAASAAVAAIKYGHSEAPNAAPLVEAAALAIPRIVVTAPRLQATESQVARVVVTASRVQEAATPVARVVVTARRPPASQVIAAK